LGLGLTVLILTAVVASSNLREIYNSQKDFVVGTLFSAVGFFFGKAFSHTQEQKALEFIQEPPNNRVAEALSGRIRRALHDRGAFEDVAVLERTVEAAAGRLLKYFDSRAQRLEFYWDSADLTYALDELDRAAADLARLRIRLEGGSVRIPSGRDVPGPALMLINRSVAAANDRGRELYEWLKHETGDAIGDDSWAVFGVLVYDIRKAERALGMLRSGRAAGYTEEYLTEVAAYLTVGLERAKAFRDLAVTGHIKMPELFTIMTGDMADALTRINKVMAEVKARSN
jgi:hypothetical protein